MPKSKQPLYTVTSAAGGHEADLKRRQKQYVILMLLRVIAFLGAVLLPLPLNLRIALLLVGGVLPWIAVQIANGSPRIPDPIEPYSPAVATLKELPGRQKG